jgi:hypothetical protein
METLMTVAAISTGVKWHFNWSLRADLLVAHRGSSGELYWIRFDGARKGLPIHQEGKEKKKKIVRSIRLWAKVI